MDSYFVIGNPISHSLSPWIHARFAQLSGLSLNYSALLAPIDAFEEVVLDLFGQYQLAYQVSSNTLLTQENSAHNEQKMLPRGCNVTVPFKYRAAQLAQWQSPQVALAGASNTLRFTSAGIEAHNTDGLGLVRDITINAKMSLEGKNILLLGAGGAGAGVLGSLLECKPTKLVLANRTLHKAQALVDSHQAVAAKFGVDLQATGLQELPGQGMKEEFPQVFDFLINASASSLQGEGLNLPAGIGKPGALAYDLMYTKSAQLPFLAWAHQQGIQTRDGLGMLVEQAAAAFEWWTGVLPPAAQVLDELRDKLKS